MRPLRFTPWPAARTAELTRRCSAGQRSSEIAAAMGVSRQVVRNHAIKIGHRFTRRGRVVVPRPLLAAPNVLPLVRSVIASDPAGGPRAASGAHPDNLRQAVASWPLHVAAYVVNVELGHPAAATARALGRTSRLVRYAVRRIENWRDDPEFDAFMERLGEMARMEAA